MVTFDDGPFEKNEMRYGDQIRYKQQNQSQEDEDGYEIGAYRRNKTNLVLKNGTSDQVPNTYVSKQNQQTRPLDQLETVYSNFAVNTRPSQQRFNNTIAEVSDENQTSPYANRKIEDNDKHKQNPPKKLEKNKPVDEVVESSEEETVVKGYAGRVKKIKQMREKMESENRHGGKNGKKNGTKQQAKEVVIETEHGNMMIKGGVDLKRLFLS